MPRASLTMLVMVLISIHTLFFFAGQEGVRPQKAGSNPHEAFITNASGDQLQDATTQENRSGILPDDFRTSFRALEGIDVVAGLLTSPYDLFADSALPEPFKTLGSVMLGFLEAYVVIMVFRGVAG